MILKNSFFGFLFLFLITGCNSKFEHSFTEEEIEEEVKKHTVHPLIIEKKGIKLTEFVDYPPFEDVTLSLLTENVRFRQGKNNLSFNINKFNLGEKTVAETEVDLKVNQAGQNLTLVTSNNKLQKHYRGEFEYEFAEGTNYFLTYLSRSYEVSLKAQGSFALFKAVTDQIKGEISVDKNEKMLVLNNPLQGESFKKDTKILLDFFLVNFSLEGTGNYLILTINNELFKLKKWSPFMIEGLDYGVYEIELKAFNQKGEQLKGAILKSPKVTIEVKEDIVFE